MYKSLGGLSMKLIRLEREGIVKLTDDALKIEELKALGYIEDGEVVIDEPTTRETEIDVEDNTEVSLSTDTDEITLSNAELKELINKAGVSVPSNATKSVLVDIAKVHGLL